MAVNQSENEESCPHLAKLLSSFTENNSSGIFSSCGKCGDVFYYSPQYSDETRQSLGSSKWGNSLRQSNAWMSLATLCASPRLRGALGGLTNSVCISPPHLAQGSAVPAAAPCCGATLGAAGLVWIRTLQEISSWFHQVLGSVVPWDSFGISPEHLCPTPKEQTQDAAASLSSTTACLWAGSCFISLCWADLENNHPKDGEPWDCVLWNCDLRQR